MIKLASYFAQMKEQIKDFLASILLQDTETPFQSGTVEELTKKLGLHSIAEYLPFETYNPETEIYECQNAKGILLEATPMAGASDNQIEAFYALLQRLLPEGTIFHCVLYASPFLGQSFDAFIKERINPHPLIKRLAEERIAFYQKGVHTLIPGQQAVFRDYQLLISLVFDNSLNLSDDKIINLKNTLKTTLKGNGMTSQIVTPPFFLQWVDALLRPRDSLYPESFHWNELDTLAHQLGAPHQIRTITPSQIFVSEENNHWQIRNFSVKHFRKNRPHLSEMSDLIGNLFDNTAQMGCPFSLSFIVQIGKQSLEQSIAATRAFRALQRAQKLAQHSQKAVKDAMDARTIMRAIEDKERVVLVSFQVSLYCKNDIESQESALMNVFQASSQKWQLVKNYLTQSVMLLAHLPLGQSSAQMKDLSRLKLTYKLWASDAANMLPVIAEMKGMNRHRLMLTGRRGQTFFWDPFGNLKGNYNTCVAGISGSGKSVTVQEIVLSLIGTNARVWIIDVGRSYKKLCQLLEGQFIEFNEEAQLCLNPFTTVKPAEFKEFIAFMVPFIGAMIQGNPESDSIQMAFIEQAIKAVWDLKGNEGSITDIAAWLLKQPDIRAKDLGTILYPYTLDGQYGPYFNGTANIDFDNPLVVFELEEVNSDKRLQSILFMLLMYHVTEKMCLGARKTEMALVIDEAWDMLKGGQGGKIIESIARRARKYSGSLITITQSIADYFASNAGLAAYKNSYWRIIQMQNQEDVNALVEDKKLMLNPFQKRLLCSVTTEHGLYAEMMILGGNKECAVGKLLLDPYSRILYSTQPKDYADVNELCDRGIPLVDAIERVARHRFPLEYGANS
jgi:conjugal transfer ATP-binding protein TraC